MSDPWIMQGITATNRMVPRGVWLRLSDWMDTEAAVSALENAMKHLHKNQHVPDTKLRIINWETGEIIPGDIFTQES